MTETRVLLVEDNRADARLLAELLSDVPGRPFLLTWVGSLAEAMPHLANHDVVLLDLSLPDAHGLTTVEHMVGAGRTRPIVVLTGMDDEQVATDALKAGAQDYLLKGEMTPSLVARSIRYAIERKRVETAELARTKSDHAADRARFLARVAGEVTRTLAVDAALTGLSKLLVPALGDAVVIHLERSDGAAVEVARASVDEKFDAAAAEAMASAKYAAAALSLVRGQGSVLRARSGQVWSALDGELEAFTTSAGATSLLLTPLVARERVIGIISYAMGRSKREHTEEDRLLAVEIAAQAALAVDNARLFEKAQEAIQARDGLLAVVSHDLRNPLDAMSLALTLLDASATEQQGRTLKRARRALDRMKRLIDDLLDVARIDAGTLQVDAEPVDVWDVLEEAYELHKPLAADKNIALVRDFSRPLATALVDRHRISQVLSNLLGNSLKFTPNGGTIRLGAGVEGGRVAIHVHDSGPGIAPENLNRVFDRFWQKERNANGVGLGLAIVKGIVEAHGGTIRAESAPGAGTMFQFWLSRLDDGAARQQRPG